jgi:mRNA interferase MazF
MGVGSGTTGRGAVAGLQQATSLPESVKRYEVRWAALDPTRGAEMAKTRPVVIVSLDVLNERLQTVTVCPLTTSLHPAWRTRLGVRLGRRAAEIAVDQIRTISKARLGRKLATLSPKDASALRRLITEMYGE